MFPGEWQINSKRRFQTNGKSTSGLSYKKKAENELITTDLDKQSERQIQSESMLGTVNAQ